MYLKQKFVQIISHSWLLLILLIQLIAGLQKIDQPILDTRLHYFYDTANFAAKAEDSAQLWWLKGFFWVAYNVYNTPWDIQRTSHYTTHPFLLPILTNHTHKIFGYHPDVNRRLFLIISLMTTILIYASVLKITKKKRISIILSTLFISLPLVYIFQKIVKYEILSLFMVWLTLYMLLVYTTTSSKKNLFLLMLVIFFGLWSDRSVYIFYWVWFVWLMVIGLWNKISLTSKIQLKRLILPVIITGIAWLWSTLATMMYLTWENSLSALKKQYQVRSNTDQSISSDVWNKRQRTFIQMNYTHILFYISIILISIYLIRFLNKRNKSDENWIYLIVTMSSLIAALVYQYYFKNGSYIHNYRMYTFITPLLLVFAQVLDLIKAKNTIIFASVCSVPGIWLLQYKAYNDFHTMTTQVIGSTDDINQLTSIKNKSFERIVVIPHIQSQLYSWFTWPLFKFYSWRWITIYKNGLELSPRDAILLVTWWDDPSVLTQFSHINPADSSCGEKFCIYFPK